MVNWPARGTKPWDTPLKAYLDGSFASKTATEAALGRVDPGTNPAANQFIANIGSQRVWIKLPYLTPMEFGAVGDGSVDDTTAATNCLTNAAAADLPVRIDRPYRVSVLTLPDNTVIETVGSGELYRTASNVNTAVLNGSGSLGSAVSLSADADLGTSTVTTSADPGVGVGDHVLLSTDRDPWDSAINRPDRDVLRVLDVSGSGPYTITLSGALAHEMAVSDGAKLQKLTPKRIHLVNPVIRYDGTAQGDGIHLNATVNPRVEGGTISKWRAYAVKMFGTFGGNVSDLTLRDTTATSAGAGYGVGIGDGTRAALIDGITSVGGRAVVVITSGSSYNTVRDSYGSGAGANFNTHGNDCRGNAFVGCRVQGTQVNSFVAGNNSYGADIGTIFDRCEALGSASATYGLFRVLNGSEDVVLRDCRASGGQHVISVEGDSARVRIEGGTFGGSSSTVVRFQDSIGSMVRGAVVIADGGTAIGSYGTSDYMVVEGNQIIGANTATNLAGVNNVNANNVEV